MNSKVMDGRLVSSLLYRELNNYVGDKKRPSIVDISIGDDFASKMYSKMKKNTLEKELDIKFDSIHFDIVSYEELKECIIKLNNDINVNGILIQLPLPDYLKDYKEDILNLIDKDKDIDGLTNYSIEAMKDGSYNYVPCTALGIDTLLKCYRVKLRCRRVAIINRSNIVGMPLSYLMNKNFSLPIICHSKTESLENITKECDIVIAALNKEEYIDSKYIKDGSVVVDVGVHKNSEGKTVGDVKFDDVYDKVKLITKSIGGVGPMTICMLGYNAFKTIYGSDIYELLNKSIEKVIDEICGTI